MKLSLLAAAALTCALTACGSTVQYSGAALSGQEGGALGTAALDGTAAAADPAAAGPAAAGAGSSTSVVAGAAGSTTGTSAGPASSGSSSTGRPPAAAAGGSRQPAGRPGGAAVAGGASGSPVELGVVIFPDVNAFAASLGGSADVGDQKAEVTTAVRWVNAHGGFAGHVVKPVFYEVSLTSTQPYSVTYQEICASFTQDHHVVATVMIGNAEAGLPACLAKGHSLLLTQGHYLHSGSDYRTLANLVTPTEPDSDRVAKAMVAELLDRGLVRKGETLGLLAMDYAAPQHAKDAIVVPAMKAHGIDVVQYTIPYPQSTPDIANSASAVQSAELAMAARGVKTVTFLCPGCASFFLDDAKSQGYYPRYLFSSYDTVGGARGQGDGRSYAGARAVGWQPLQDVGGTTDPGLLRGNATAVLCRTVEKGQYTADPSTYAALSFCGALLNLKAAADAAPGGATDVASLVRGFEALGATSPGVQNFTTRLAPGVHDGTAGYRPMHYEAGCDCFAYDSGAVRAFPAA